MRVGEGLGVGVMLGVADGLGVKVGRGVRVNVGVVDGCGVIVAVEVSAGRIVGIVTGVGERARTDRKMAKIKTTIVISAYKASSEVRRISPASESLLGLSGGCDVIKFGERQYSARFRSRGICLTIFLDMLESIGSFQVVRSIFPVKRKCLSRISS